MIRILARRALLEFSKADYPLESLQAAAQGLGDGVEVHLEEKGRLRLVEIRLARPSAAGRLPALAGGFADAALNHAYRQRVVRFHGPRSAAVLARLFARGFTPVPADPLEQLEPQVRLDRARDAQALLDEARAMGGR